jgi:hypothetical protein
MPRNGVPWKTPDKIELKAEQVPIPHRQLNFQLISYLGEERSGAVEVLERQLIEAGTLDA